MLPGGRVVFSGTVQWTRKPSSLQNLNSKNNALACTRILNHMQGNPARLWVKRKLAGAPSMHSDAGAARPACGQADSPLALPECIRMPAQAARLWVKRQPVGAPRVHSDAGAGGPPVGQGTSAKVDGLRLDARFCAGRKGAPTQRPQYYAVRGVRRN